MSVVPPYLRRIITARDGTCRATAMGGPCGGTLTIHHILPRSVGGTNRRTNLILVCWDHHARIHTPRYRDAAIAYGLLADPAPGVEPLGVKLTEDVCRELGLPWAVPNAKRLRARLIATGAVRPPGSQPIPGPVKALPPGLRPWECERCATVTLAPARPAECERCGWPHGGVLWVDDDGTEYAITPRGGRELLPVDFRSPRRKVPTMTATPVRYTVVLRDDQGPVFDCISGTSDDTDGFETQERSIEPGTVIAAIESVADSFNQTMTLYLVTEDGVNEIDEQPAVGDLIVSVCPPDDILFQAGMLAVVLEDRAVATVSIGTILTLFPLLAENWMAQLPALLADVLGNLPTATGPRVRTYAYGAFARPGNLDGTDLTIDIPDGLTGAFAERTVNPGDHIAFVLDSTGDAAVVEVRVAQPLPADGEDPTPWPLADQQPQTGDIIVSNAPLDQQPAAMIGLVSVCVAPGKVVNAQAGVFNMIFQALNNPGPTPEPEPTPDPEPAPPAAALPTHATPMEDMAWDGTDNVFISADTSLQPIVISIPPAEGDAINSTLIVKNRTGSNDVTIAVNAVEDHQGDILIPPGHVATIRAINGTWELIGWL